MTPTMTGKRSSRSLKSVGFSKGAAHRITPRGACSASPGMSTIRRSLSNPPGITPASETSKTFQPR